MLTPVERAAGLPSFCNLTKGVGGWDEPRLEKVDVSIMMGVVDWTLRVAKTCAHCLTDALIKVFRTTTSKNKCVKEKKQAVKFRLWWWTTLTAPVCARRVSLLDQT
jgi:hypothetical protein